MRVINTTTLQLEDIDPTADESHYAILSHTWGSDEVLFDDVRNLGPNELTRLVHKKGTSKVSKACAQAKREGYKYIWIDTCCIDKSSSAELSEAINSMFQWYAQADICYAYLDDVTANDDDLQSTLYRNSRWFKRGWTLQELIAPLHLVFFDHAWVRIGIRSSFSSEIAEITSIDKSLLDRHRTSDSSDNMVDLTRDLAAMDVSTRMSWARFRETTRGEDLAYCLMGLFDVNMPLLYGEGGEKAFVRLQREIIAGRSDQSILAWTPLDYPTNGGRWGRGQVSLLARSPRVRFLVGAEQHLSSSSLTEFSLHGNRIRATVFLGKIYCHAGAWPEYHQTYIAVLNFQARDSSSFVDRPALRLRNLPQAQGDAIYQKINNSILWVKMLHDGKISVSQRDGTSSGKCAFDSGMELTS
ncbi:HET-domain-containing protein [Podospora conica]|nr:HET-domain-containing protein [Schizothecium conicum]